MATHRMQEFAQGKEISPEEIKATNYYIEQIQNNGFLIGKKGLPKLVRTRVAAYVRNPNEHSLLQLSDYFAERALNPSSSEVEAIKGWSSSIADRIHPSITLALVYARALDEIKVDTVGLNTSTQPINSLMGYVLTETMWRANDMDDADIDDAYRLAQAATKTDDPHAHWYVPKIMPLVGAAQSKKETSDFLRKIHPYEKSHGANELKEANDELFETTKKLQKFGVKPCIAPALPQSSTYEWLVSPIRRDLNPVPAYHPARSLMAAFTGSTKPIKSTETAKEEFTSEFERGATISYASLVASGIEANTGTANISLGKDGHLYYMYGQRILDYIDPSLSSYYEQLRSEILSIYFDSVVPVFITERVNKEAAVAPKRKLGRIAIGFKKGPDLRNLVLARKRILLENLKEAEEELEHPESDLVENEKRKITKHDVIWHIRKLPPNYRASAEARARCLEETGIELAEYGETYVKSHERGSLENKSKGHKAKFTMGKMAAKLSRGH